jgi:hypothetical protein
MVSLVSYGFQKKTFKIICELLAFPHQADSEASGIKTITQTLV